VLLVLTTKSRDAIEWPGNLGHVSEMSVFPQAHEIGIAEAKNVHLGGITQQHSPTLPDFAGFGTSGIENSLEQHRAREMESGRSSVAVVGDRRQPSTFKG
jgi:hypothetical protein